ncbi:hypothetical protein [Spirillospora sp. NPDC029432]|uniref:hypothetical protein n=1 Tax=Spirillospora sp. NPDC029432 TaxID=3154599 RepID=UPI00345368DE
MGYDDGTDVLTDAGWIPWPNIAGNEMFGTVHPVSGELTYRTAVEVSHVRYDGPMYRVRSEQIDLLVTPAHPLWIQRADTRAARRGEQPYALERADAVLHKRVRYQKTARWLAGSDADVVTPAASRHWVRSDNGAHCVRYYPEAVFPAHHFARFLGYYLAEGSVNGHVIVLAQNRGPLLDKMAATVRALGLPAYIPTSGDGSVRTQCTSLRDLLATLGHSHDKVMPDIVGFWSADLARSLLDAMVEGDGTTHRGNGHRVIYTASPALADALQVLAIKAGLSANIRLDDRVGVERVMPGGQRFRNRRVCYVVSLVARRNRPLVNHGRHQPSRYWNAEGFHDGLEGYRGSVHSAVIDDALLLVRRGGKPVVVGAGS